MQEDERGAGRQPEKPFNRLQAILVGRDMVRKKRVHGGRGPTIQWASWLEGE